MTTSVERGPSPSPAPARRAGRPIELRGVSQVFRSGRTSRAALERVDLEVPPGELVCLVGPSGCGKSTLLNLVAGFQTPSTGEVLVDGRPVTGPGPDRGVVFQQPWLTVRRNVEFGLRMARVGRVERRERAESALELVGLADVADRAPHELSGGMQQRAAIARALVNNPGILLMDEPFAALDALTRERLQDELLRWWSATGMTVVFVTHSVDEAIYLGTRVIALSARPGRVVHDRGWDRSGPPASRDDPVLVGRREELRAVVWSAVGAPANG